MNVIGQITTSKKYKFHNIKDLTFNAPVILVLEEIDNVKRSNMTVHVNLRIKAEGSANGYFAPDVNPVSVNNLNGDNPLTILERIEERLVDFEI
jgi:hypothetical protein